MTANGLQKQVTSAIQSITIPATATLQFP